MLSRALGFLICVIALMLPHRLRVWFSEFLGWITQGVYYAYYGLLNYLVANVKQTKTDAVTITAPRSNVSADDETTEKELP